MGHTASGSSQPPPWPVHPHIRGAYGVVVQQGQTVIGSSPHTWGIPCIAWQTKTTTTVHPHIRGAYSLCVHRAPGSSGSSPHTWGIPLTIRNRPGADRFIPTYVGHTRRGRASTANSIGSSPHTWGILQSITCGDFICRFIPTYVGHTALITQRYIDTPVHPHIRGAYITVAEFIKLGGGSSPHTWGIP